MDWTDDRAEQLQELRNLLAMVSALNHGNHFLENVKFCIKTAECLQESHDLHPSFISYLEKICVAEREKGKQ
jgi:hypothetical protein